MRDAARYTSAYRNVDWFDPEAASDRPVVMAGHQPSLFHAGVWFKNRMLDEIARRSGATPINLVIDNDMASGVAVRVPTMDVERDRIRSAAVTYDSVGGGVPYEQTAIRDRERFATFPNRLKTTLSGIVRNPSVDRLWPHATRALDRCDIAACALAQARHALEGELGWRTLELPLAVAVRGPEFARFVWRILDDLDRYRTIYNDRVDEYRRLHGIRSDSHPVPKLGVDGDWIETPLWVYGDDRPTRRPVWCRRDGDGVVLSDRDGTEMRIVGSDPDAITQQWVEQSDANRKWRPRALLTTAYARLVLSDAFIHGIGGGMYDQLNDRILEDFFGFAPPPFMVTSATVKLPDAPEPAAVSERIRDIQRSIRDCRFRGERFVDRLPVSALPLVRRKRDLLDDIPPRGSKLDWHREIETINRQLHDALIEVRAELFEQLEAAKVDLAEARLLSSREIPLVAMPLDRMTQAFDALLSR